MDLELLEKAKAYGFSDRQIAHLTGRTEDEVRDTMLLRMRLVPYLECDEQGYDSVAEVKEAQEEGALVEALHLKPGKAKLLLKRIGESD